MSKLQKIWIFFLNLVFWGMLAYYLKGGVRVDQKIKYTYMADIWVACGVLYIVSRLFLGVRFRDLSFGRAFYEMAEQTLNSFTKRSLAPLFTLSRPALVLLASATYLLFLFFFIPVFQHWAYGNYVFDLGVIENAMYNFVHTGRFDTWYLTHDWQPLQYVPNNRLNLGLLFFAAFYKLGFEYAELMLFFQSVALITALIPLYKLADLILPREIPRWFPLLFYVLWDPIHRMNIWDFHETPFVIPFCLWGFYFIEKNQLTRAFVSMLLMAIWREDAWWAFSGMSFYAALRTKRYFLCLPGVAIGFLAFPAFAHFFNRVNSVGSRYSFLGPDMYSALTVAFTKPWVFLIQIYQNREFFTHLLLNSGGGIFLLGGWAMLPLLPNLAEVGLSSHGGMLSWLNHYVGTFAGPLFFATLFGYRRVYLLSEALSAGLGRKVLGVSLALCLTQLSFNEPGALSNTWDRYQNTRCYDPLLAAIPADVPILSSNPIAPRISRRKMIAEPDWGLEQSWADYLVIREDRFLQSGLMGIRPNPGWVPIFKACDFTLYKRKDLF